MLEYNKSKNILYAYRSNTARPNLQKDGVNRNIYESYLKYKNVICKKDVLEIFLPALRNALRVDERLLDIHEDDIVIKHVDPGVFNDRTDHVTTKMSLLGCTQGPMSDVTIMKLPSVHEDGTIEYESKRYAFIHMLEQEPAISFESNEDKNKSAMLKVKNEFRSMWIVDDARMLKVEFSDLKGKSSKKKFKLIDVITEMAIYEGYDIYEIFDEFANFSIVNMFKDEKDMTTHFSYAGGNVTSVNAIEYKDKIVPRLTLTRIKQDGTGDDSYDNSSIEDNLCKLLSLDRALGEILAKDVYSQLNPERRIAVAGSTVDNTMLSVFKSEGVYKIYVKYIPNIEGYYLAESIMLAQAPAGLRITDTLREFFPEEKGMYTSRDYPRLDVPIIFDEGEVLTYDIINTISTFGINTIKIKDKKSGGRIKTLNFYEEIISNRKFNGSDIGLEDGVWYYLDSSNKFKTTNGCYTTYDLVALYSFCTKLFEGKWISHVVNSDIGFRKVLIPIAEQYKRAFAFAVREGFTQMNRKLKTMYTNNRMDYLDRDKMDNQFYPFSKNFWRYLRDEAKCIVSLSGDNIHNPISYASACTKVNVYTANKHSVADSQRDIAMGSFGKIDPFEIPQSGKLGTVYNSTCDVLIDENGIMKTPYYAIRGNKVLTNEIVYLTSEEEERHIIADICALQLDSNGFIQNPDDITLCKVPSVTSIEKQTFAHRRVKDVRYVNINATQQLSWASSTIPYMSSNDAARAVFAVAQEKQAKGLVEPDEPYVMTSAYEQFVWLNDKFGIISKCRGIVRQISYDLKENTYSIFIATDKLGTPDEEGITYTIPPYLDSGYSVTKYDIVVKEGQTVERGDMIVSSNFISKNGILQFGKNALTGYICNGYNYEDGSHMSDSFCSKLSSYRINTEEFKSNPSNTRVYRLQNRPVAKYIRPHMDCADISYSDARYLRKVKKTLPFTHAYGFYEDTEPIKSKTGKGNFGVTVKTVSVDKFKAGDKSSNRHGNKGVMSSIRPQVTCDANMPRLLNGKPLEVCLNPLGVGSRMNIGQIKEIHSGLICHVLNTRISTDAYNSISESEIRDLMRFTVKLMNSTGDPSPVFSEFSNLIDLYGEDFFEHCRENINHIREWAGCFNENGTTKVILPANDGKLTETEVLIGYLYIFKLIQESHKKLHARGGETMGEPYGEVSDAPTHGSSKGGGQRFGTMEMDALCAYGTSAYIQELTNERCDNAIARNNLYVDTYLPAHLRKEYRIKDKGQRRAVTQFLYTMLSLGVMCEPNNGEFVPLSHTNGVDLSHWKPSVLQRGSLNYMNKKNTGDNEEQETIVETEVKDKVDTKANSLVEAARKASESVEDEHKRNAASIILGL